MMSLIRSLPTVPTGCQCRVLSVSHSLPSVFRGLSSASLLSKLLHSSATLISGCSWETFVETQRQIGINQLRSTETPETRVERAKEEQNARYPATNGASVEIVPFKPPG